MMTENSTIVNFTQEPDSSRMEELREFARTEYSDEEAGWFLTEIRRALASTFGVHGGKLCLHAAGRCPHGEVA